MAKFFSPDSKFYKFMQRLTDVFLLNMIWLLCSLPIVTIGISTIAASKVTLDMSEEREGRVVHDFLREFKRNRKQGLAMSFISLLSVWAVYLDFQLFHAAQEHEIVFLIIGIVAAYLLLFSQLYVYPLLARYDNTLIRSMKNSFRISMKYFLRSLLLAVTVAFEFAIIFWNYTTMFVGVIIGPVFIIYTISGFSIHIFRELEKDPNTVVDRSAEEKDEE